jgi:hypothetical protein
MRQKFVAASTAQRDRHGNRLTLESLESMLVAMRGVTRPALNVEHDPVLPPLGQLIDGWVEPTSDGEYRLIVEAEVYENMYRGEMPDGTVLVKQEGGEDGLPFAAVCHTAPASPVIGYDRANFVSQAALDHFLADLRSCTQVPFEHEESVRWSLIPDPLLIFTFGQAVCAYLLGRKVTDKLADEIGSDLASFYTLVKTTLRTYAAYARPRSRPKTYVFRIPGHPHVEFVARSARPATVMRAIVVDNLTAPLAQAKELAAGLQADKVQFLLNSSGEWELNYLLTQTGAVIGSPASFAARNVLLLNMQLGETSRPQSGGGVTAREHNRSSRPRS